MADIKKAGLLGAALVGGVSAAASAQEFLTQDDIEARVADMQANSEGSSVFVGGGGGTVAGSNGGTADQINIGGTTGTAIADASGGDSNVAFVS